jgi:hypothetical protein
VSIVVRFDPETVESVRTAVTLVRTSPTVMLYVGPDQIMPLTSVLGAIVGVALMFWNRIVGLVGRGWSALTRREHPAQTDVTKTQA